MITRPKSTASPRKWFACSVRKRFVLVLPRSDAAPPSMRLWGEHRRLLQRLLASFALSALLLVGFKLLCQFRPIKVTIARQAATPKALVSVFGGSIPSVITQFEPYDP